RGAERPCHAKDDQPDDDVRRAERDREVLRQPLVEHVPRREAEIGLEQADDPACEEEQAADEARAAGRRPAANPRSGVVLYSPNGLKGFGEVEWMTLFVSR